MLYYQIDIFCLSKSFLTSKFVLQKSAKMCQTVAVAGFCLVSQIDLSKKHFYVQGKQLGLILITKSQRARISSGFGSQLRNRLIETGGKITMAEILSHRYRNMAIRHELIFNGTVRHLDAFTMK